MTTLVASSPRVAVTLAHYFAERIPNLFTILDACRASTAPPAEVLIWNNDAPFTPTVLAQLQAAGGAVIQSPKNLGCQGRLLAALLTDADEILTLGNDTAPDPGMIANLLHWRQHYPDAVLTLEGRTRRPGRPYASWPKTYGSACLIPHQVTHTFGRGELTRRAWLPAIFAHFPFGPATVMDDLWYSAAVDRTGRAIYVVPTVKGTSHLGDLPGYLHGLSRQPGWGAARDAVVAEIDQHLEAR